MKFPTPFLGRCIIEALEEDVEGYMKEKAGISRSSLIALPETFIAGNRVPLKKGKILQVSSDFCGDNFRQKCGDDVGDVPVEGDIVWFVPNETYALDIEKKYHLLNDCDIVAFERGTENV
jgi:hypothetical protein